LAEAETEATVDDALARARTAILERHPSRLSV
jgi:hypothetical protein